MKELRTRLLRLALEVGAILLLAVLLAGNFVADHSVTIDGYGFSWNDARYIPCTADHTEGKVIARSNSGWSICEVEEDETHTFLVMRSFLDQQLCVREDYAIPYDGVLSAVFWGGKKNDNPEFCEIISKILENFRAERTYRTDAIFSLTDTRQMRDISFCWNDCPVGVDREDFWLGKLEGRWVLAKGKRSTEETDAVDYDIFPIPEEYVHVLEKYCKI